MNVLLHSLSPTLQQVTTNPHLHWRLLDTYRQVWVSLLWGHCSFPPGPGGTQGSARALQEPLSQSRVSSGGSMVGEWLPRPRGPLPCPGLRHPEPLPLRESTAGPGLLRRRAHTALAQPVWGPWVLVPLFECSEHLWQEWGLILNANPTLLPSC